MFCSQGIFAPCIFALSNMHTFAALKFAKTPFGSSIINLKIAPSRTMGPKMKRGEYISEYKGHKGMVLLDMHICQMYSSMKLRYFLYHPSFVIFVFIPSVNSLIEIF